MSFESPQSRVESFEHKEIRVSLEIQRTLFGRMADPDSGQGGLDKWIFQYGKSFRIAFESMLRDDPQMLDKYDQDPEQYLGIFREHLESIPEEELRKAA